MPRFCGAEDDKSVSVVAVERGVEAGRDTAGLNSLAPLATLVTPNMPRPDGAGPSGAGLAFSCDART